MLLPALILQFKGAGIFYVFFSLIGDCQVAAVCSYFGRIFVVNKNFSAHPAFLFYFCP